MEAYASIYQLYFYIMELNYKKKLLMSGMDNKKYTGLRFTAEEDNVQFTFSTSEKIRYWAPHSVWMRLVNNGSELKKFPSIPLKKGESVVICGGFSNSNGSTYNGTFSSTGKFSVSGNIMSLIGEYNNPYQESFINKVNLTGYNYVFYKLFLQCAKLIDAKDLILPATTLSYGCYYMMFKGCTSLAYPPVLPAMTVYQDSYREMFCNCSKLVSAPALPATNIGPYCYQDMFFGCSILAKAPALPATTLAVSCYRSMFNKCSGLINAPELRATTLVANCYQSMFKSCTSLINAPALPATTLVANCYQDMFNGCSNLSNITMLATNTSASNCLLNWVNNVKNTGTITIGDNPDLISNKTEDNWYGPSLIPKDTNNRWVINSEGDYNPLSIDNKSEFNIRVGYSRGTGIVSKYKIVDTSILESYNNTFGAYNDFSNMIDMPSYSTADVNNTTKELQPGQSIIFLGSLSDTFGEGDVGSIIIKLPNGTEAEDLGEKDIYVSGSILSMIYGNNYNRYYSIPNNVNFYNLFVGEPITYARNLILDFELHNNRIDNCGIYESMFQNCVALKIPPSTISRYAPPYCFQSMFSGSGITKMPSLPAEIVGDYSYASMFEGCENLKITTVDSLRAHTLGVRSYEFMFSGSGIDKIPTLRKSVTASSHSYYYMFTGCYNLTTISDGKICSVTQYSDDGGCCFEGMFSGCDNLKFGKIPSCPITLGCFSRLFEGCYNLIGLNENKVDTSTPGYITVNGINYHDPEKKSYKTLAPNCFEEMFSGCSSLVIPPINLQEIETLAPYCFKNMFYNCGSLVYGPFLPMTNLTLGSINNKPTYSHNYNQGDHHCFEGMFAGCSSLKSLGIVTDYNNNQINTVILPGKKLASYCYYNMFNGCTGITSAHICAETPKTDVYNNSQHYAYECYRGMFDQCENLNNVKIADIDCYGGLETQLSSSPLPQGSDSNLASGYYFGDDYEFWMSGVKDRGSFYKPSGSNLGYVIRLAGSGLHTAGVVPHNDLLSDKDYNWSLSTSIAIATEISMSNDGWILGTGSIKIATRI